MLVFAVIMIVIYSSAVDSIHKRDRMIIVLVVVYLVVNSLACILC